MMEAKAEEQGSSDDVIELQLKRAREEIAALQDDKDQLSQVSGIELAIMSMRFFMLFSI